MKLLAALFVLVACTTTEDPPTDEVARFIDPGDPTCPSWGCGENSATVGDGLIFDELDRTGNAPNRGGLQIIDAVAADTTPVRLDIDRQWLRAVALDGSRVYEGADLVGMIVTLWHPVKGKYEVRVSAYKPQTLTYWAGWGEAVPVYELQTRKKGSGKKFVDYACRAELTTDPLWMSAPHYAIIYAGDRFDPVTKVDHEVGFSSPWFNIACAATAVAKMHLMRHTLAGGLDLYGWPVMPTTEAQRTAMLKMFTADYCGTGHTFTMDGVRLAYQDEFQSTNLLPYAWTESLWTETGASCLDVPRLVDRDYVETVCGRTLPACGDTTDWALRAHVFSGSW